MSSGSPGQKIRAGAWNVKSGEIPPSVRDGGLCQIEGRQTRRAVYPVVPFAQNPEWLVSSKSNPARKYASLGVRSLQDWLIETLVTFHQRTGIGGYAFDHTFLGYEGTSRYAQWAGWRRVMEEVRRRIPDLVIDGRQAYHLYGPWSWLAGSYPHPTFNDEQPESFVPFPDLHFDRVSADRQRYTAYRYRVYDFAPNEIVPGFITHQTPRNDETGRMPEGRTEDRGTVPLPLRARDWDYLGWRYSLLSSIATGGWNNVINMIPARDSEESSRFSEDDRRWFRTWIDWTRENKDYLRHTQPILGPPSIGHVDGTSAILSNRGFIFFFNPNGRRLSAEITLDDTIGLSARGAFVLKELFPLSGRLVGKPNVGVWALVTGCRSRSMAVQRLCSRFSRGRRRLTPYLQRTGTATMDGEALAIAGARGEVGSTTDLFVQLPQGVRCNGDRQRPAGRDRLAPRRASPSARHSTARCSDTINLSSRCRKASPVARSPGRSRFRDASSTSWPRGAKPGRSLDARGLPHHVACTGTAPVVRPDRGAGRALGRTADHRRSHGGAEEGVLGHPERGKDLRRLLRRSVDAGCGSSVHVRARAPEAGSRSAAGGVLRECGDRVHGKDRKVLEVLGFYRFAVPGDLKSMDFG
jgi:hypothetical protein